MSSASSYSEKDIKILEGLEAVRKRPGMYIGSTGARGLHHLIYEIVDNSVDEALAGECSRIEVTLEPGQVVTVRDNGRGIPTGIHPQAEIPVPELIFTRLHAGGKFDNDSYKVSGGLHGVGSSVVNALSSFFEYEIHRGGRIFGGRFENGGHIAVPMTEFGTTKRTGTTVRFCPDASIFETTEFTYRTIAERLQELAFLNPGLTLKLSDKRGERQDNEWHYPGGLRQYVAYLNESVGSINDVVHFVDEADGVQVEVAFQYTDGYSETVLSFVNCINTREGGQHETGFRTAHTRVLNEYARRMGLWKKKDNLGGDDLREGITAIVSLRMRNPEFEGQTKTKLGNSDARAAVDGVVAKHLARYLEENPDAAKTLVEKASRAKAARDAARKARDLTRSGTSVGAKTSLGGKLTRCASRNPAECELFIVEGDSAGGSAKQGRDRRTQAILPLRGKPLNTERAQLDKILKNKEILSIIQAIGGGIGAEFSLADSNYGRVIILADADDDGAHIRCLLLTFFYRYMRPLLDTGCVFIGQPPLFKVEGPSTPAASKKSGTGGKKHTAQVTYAWSKEEMQRVLKDYRGGVTVQRYKGLGEMNADQLWETTLNPDTRTLVQVSVDDAASAERQLRVLMGDSAETRRKWLTENVRFGDVGTDSERVGAMQLQKPNADPDTGRAKSDEEGA